MLKKKAQSTIEYSMLIIIILGVFLAAGPYVKRGIQGRWKAAADDLGDQYDPRTSNTMIRHALISNQEMRISVVNQTNPLGAWTNRTDISDTTETKQGDVIIGP
jgi:hypothetical protein